MVAHPEKKRASAPQNQNRIALFTGSSLLTIRKPKCSVALEKTWRSAPNILSAHPADAYAATKAALLAGVTDVTEAETQAFIDHVVPTWTSDRIRAKIRSILGG